MPDEANELLARLGVPVSEDEGPKLVVSASISIVTSDVLTWWRGRLIERLKVHDELKKKHGKKE